MPPFHVAKPQPALPSVNCSSRRSSPGSSNRSHSHVCSKDGAARGCLHWPAVWLGGIQPQRRPHIGQVARPCRDAVGLQGWLQGWRVRYGAWHGAASGMASAGHGMAQRGWHGVSWPWHGAARPAWRQLAMASRHGAPCRGMVSRPMACRTAVPASRTWKHVAMHACLCSSQHKHMYEHTYGACPPCPSHTCSCPPRHTLSAGR